MFEIILIGILMSFKKNEKSQTDVKPLMINQFILLECYNSIISYYAGLQ